MLVHYSIKKDLMDDQTNERRHNLAVVYFIFAIYL
jgi:hypothetical protein